jgi:hypothetical protein
MVIDSADNSIYLFAGIGYGQTGTQEGKFMNLLISSLL